MLIPVIPIMCTGMFLISVGYSQPVEMIMETSVLLQQVVLRAAIERQNRQLFALRRSGYGVDVGV